MTRKNNNSFFDVYAHEYDALTDASNRKTPHEREVKAMINYFEPSSVLDAGCATGLTGYLFAKNNISTTPLRPIIKSAIIDTPTHDISSAVAVFESL